MREKLPERIFRWYLLLNKRLLRKLSFIAVLLSLPLLTFAMRNAAKEESGVLHILLFQEDKKDSLSSSIAKELLERESVIRFSRIEDKEEGLALLRQGKADALWILPAELKEKLEKHIEKGKPVFEIWEREESSVLRLSREKLYKAVFPHLSYLLYLDFMAENVQEAAKSEADLQEEFKEYYEGIEIEGELLQFALLQGKDYVKKDIAENYLLSPLRGIMAIWLVLCGFAAAMYFLKDLQSGLFSLIPAEHRIWVSLAYQLSIMLNAGAIMLIALFVSKTARGLPREIGAMFLLIIALIGFCNLFRLIFSNIYIFCSLIPFVIIVFLVLSPIFADIGMRGLQYLIPTYYYLNLVHSTELLPAWLIYIAVIYLLNIAAEMAGSQRVMGLKT
ncbi:MAG: hypothetical protein Q4A19_09145 [Johnsonella sp.]|nr:hypothetical protein [Johnsonella sp.]